MTLKHSIQTIAVALTLAALLPAHAAEKAPAPAKTAQKTYAAPEEAAKALADAIRADDMKALLAVVGPDARGWLSSGDDVADREGRKRFVAAYDRKHAISRAADDKVFLTVGEDDWPFPAPLLRQAKGWAFDAQAGREEIINRRIGRNELDTIQTLLAIVDAQREYAGADPDRNGFHDYARRFRSSPGKKDGLFWPTAAGEPNSPLGSLIAVAAREGYGQGKADDGKPGAYHGYRYRILTAQGRNAPGGAYSYLVKERLIGGFAVVAYPVQHGSSGVMTFIVNHDGVVYQKNLGPGTEGAASKMRSYDPDASWKAVQ